MIAISVCLGLIRRWKTRAQRFACKMEWKERLNVELSETGEKLRLIFVKIYEWLQFACFRFCFDAGKRVHCALHVKWSEKSV